MERGSAVFRTLHLWNADVFPERPLDSWIVAKVIVEGVVLLEDYDDSLYLGGDWTCQSGSLERDYNGKAHAER